MQVYMEVRVEGEMLHKLLTTTTLYVYMARCLLAFSFFFVNVIKREFLFLILVGETFSPTVSCDEWRLLPRHFFFLCAMTWKGD